MDQVCCWMLGFRAVQLLAPSSLFYNIMSDQYSRHSLIGVESRASRLSTLRTQTMTKASSTSQKQEVAEVAIDEIKFRHKLGESSNFINRDLKIQNQSGEHVLHFVIKCNNPLHYTVRPSQGDIPPGKTLEISIEINKVEEVTEIGRNFFAKLASDKFKVELYESVYSKKAVGERIPNSYKSKTLQVYIDYAEQPISTRELPKQQMVEVESKLQEAINLHKKELIRLEGLIVEQQRKKIKSQWVSGRCLWFLGACAFVGGALIPL